MVEQCKSQVEHCHPPPPMGLTSRVWIQPANDNRGGNLCQSRSVGVKPVSLAVRTVIALHAAEAVQVPDHASHHPLPESPS
jgi:hypothetical protein